MNKKKQEIPHHTTSTMRRLRKEALVGLSNAFSSVMERLPANAEELIEQLHRNQVELEERNEELRESKIELEESRQKYRELYEVAPVGYCSLDSTGTILDINQTAQSWLGIEPGKQGKPIFLPFVAADERERFLVFLRRIFETEGYVTEDIQLDSPQRGGFWVKLVGKVIPSLAHDFTVCLLTLVDITEQKQQELQHSQLEIRLRHQQKLESIGQLAAGVAHELNTPIQYINDNIQFLEDSFRDMVHSSRELIELLIRAHREDNPHDLIKEALTMFHHLDMDYLLEEIPSAIRQTQTGTEHVAGIVRAMKRFAHPQTGQLCLIDLNQAIEDTVLIAQNQYKYVADLVLDLEPELPRLACDPGEMNQVFLALLLNAAQAIEDKMKRESAEKGVITVKSRVLDNQVEIRISDTGTGIPETIRNRVFDPFFTTRDVGKGSGQGLTLSHAVVVGRHRGSLDFVSQEGVGTTFLIRLPRELPVMETSDSLHAVLPQQLEPKKKPDDPV